MGHQVQCPYRLVSLSASRRFRRSRATLITFRFDLVVAVVVVVVLDDATLFRSCCFLGAAVVPGFRYNVSACPHCIGVPCFVDGYFFSPLLTPVSRLLQFLFLARQVQRTLSVSLSLSFSPFPFACRCASRWSVGLVVSVLGLNRRRCGSCLGFALDTINTNTQGTCCCCCDCEMLSTPSFSVLLEWIVIKMVAACEAAVTAAANRPNKTLWTCASRVAGWVSINSNHSRDTDVPLVRVLNQSRVREGQGKGNDPILLVYTVNL